MIKGIKAFRLHIYIGQLALLVVLSAGWWGILYPNFSMTEETFETLEEEPSALSCSESFFAMLEAEPDEIEIRSRFWEAILGERGKEDEQQCTDRGF